METVQRVMSREVWSWHRREPITQLSLSSSRALGIITESVKRLWWSGVEWGEYFTKYCDPQVC